MMWYNYLIPPLLGAAIGYGTNELALRMLFRPYRPKCIFGWRLPFTPGIIPKEKARLAESIGELVSENLMDKDTLSKNLLSEEMVAKVENGFLSFMEQLKNNETPLRDALPNCLPNVEGVSKRFCEEFSALVGSRISASNLSREISEKVVQYALERMSDSLLGYLGAGKLMGKFSDHLEKKLTKHIDTILQENAEDIIHQMADHEVEQLLDKPLSELMEGREALIEKGKRMAVKLYVALISEQLPRMLESIDVKKIVEARINEMDISEVEKITYQVMNHELRAIVWLGALLGAILGFFNLLLL